jgi:hypothetical protein
MELQQVALARLVQTFRASGGTLGYFPELAEKLAKEYGFVGLPRPEQFLPNVETGAEFQHGRALIGTKTVVIDKLTVFRDGIVIDTSSSTDDCDLLLVHLLRWAETASVNIELTGPRTYVSQVIVRLESALDILSSVSALVSDRIGSLLPQYGINAPKYALNAINWLFDQIERTTGTKPGPFVIERRADTPFVENLYFSQAPLKTRDHLALITAIETQLQSD